MCPPNETARILMGLGFDSTAEWQKEFGCLTALNRKLQYYPNNGVLGMNLPCVAPGSR